MVTRSPLALPASKPFSSSAVRVCRLQRFFGFFRNGKLGNLSPHKSLRAGSGRFSSTSRRLRFRLVRLLSTVLFHGLALIVDDVPHCAVERIFVVQVTCAPMLSPTVAIRGLIAGFPQ